LNGNMSAGPTTPAKLMGVSIFITIYAIMPLMNLILIPKISRILNIIIAILFIVVWLFILTQFSFTAMWNFYIYLAVCEIVLALVIIYLSWNWPKMKK